MHIIKGSKTTTFGCILLPILYVPMYKCNKVTKINFKVLHFVLCNVLSLLKQNTI